MEVLQRTANRGSISTGYDIENSLKFEDATNERLYRNNPNSGQRRTYTVAMWLKRTELGYNRIWGVGISGNDIQAPYFKDTDELIWYDYGGGGYRFNYHTNRKFRDTSAWYHLVFAVDTEQSTEADRVKLYVNGVEETSFSTQTEPSQNADTNWNYQGTWDVGTAVGEDPHFSGYMSEVYFIDDQQLDCTNFGEFDDDTGIWKPKAFSGTFGSNDVYANFDDASSLGADSSGNSNDWGLINITAADQATDTPTNNFCIMNVNSRTNSDITTSQGGTVVSNSGASICSMNASMGVSNGKWYWECRFANDPGLTNTVFVGIAATNDPYVPHNSNNYLGQQTGYGSIGWYFVNGGIYNGTGTWTGPGYGNIIMFALDMDNLKLYFGKEGVWQNSSNPVTNTNGIDIATSFTSLSGGTDIIVPAISVAGGDNMDSMNFGGFANYTQASTETDENGYGTFEYAPPSGYYALCGKNLAEYGGTA